jgi:hypothetical protein
VFGATVRFPDKSKLNGPALTGVTTISHRSGCAIDTVIPNTFPPVAVKVSLLT